MGRVMKDSGIAWIGEIPEEWRFSRIKYVADFEPRCDFSNMNSDSVVTYTPMEHIKKGYFIPNDAILCSLSSSLTPYLEGDIVMAKVTPCFENGNIAIMTGLSSGVGYGSSELFVFRAKFIDRKFLFYWLQNDGFKQQAISTMTGTGGLKRVSPIFVRNCILYLPSCLEQSRIAAFLDCRCAEIDRIMEQTRATIEGYKRLKQSIITESVIHGVRGQRKMKDSGVEWIGEIPEEWGTAKLKTIIISVESGVSVNAAQYAAEDGFVGVLKTSCVSKFRFIPTENKAVNIEEINRVSCPVRADTLIMSRMNTPDLVGACGYVEQDYPNLYLPDRLWQVRFAQGCNTKYLWYYLNSVNIRSYYGSLAVGTSSSMQNISQDQLYNTMAVLPTKIEQDEIVNYLDCRCTEIDRLIDTKQQLLTQLEAYKKSVIYEYVTGKREVPQ